MNTPSLNVSRVDLETMIAATVKILESHAPPLNMVHHHNIKSVTLCDVNILHSQNIGERGGLILAILQFSEIHPIL